MDKFIEYDEQFIDYINRNSKYKIFIKCNQTFEMICRISFILGDPIQYWIGYFI